VRPDETITIDAPAEEHDAILLDRVAGWAELEPVSYLRANKPDWRLEVTRHRRDPLPPDATEAVADSGLVLALLVLERQGRLVGSRRELLLRAMRRVTDGLAMSRDERVTLHREGYLCAVELGRWDQAGVAAAGARFVGMRDRLGELLALPCDPASEKRWALLARPDGPQETVIAKARDAIRLHANRLGVFAEAEAILHYFLFRLDTT
jgi:hypothetical protein